MDQPESKRPRLSASNSSWSAGSSSHHGAVSLPHPAPPHHATSPAQYQRPSDAFSRPSEAPPPPPPLQIQTGPYEDRRHYHEHERYQAQPLPPPHPHPHSHPPPPRQDHRPDARQQQLPPSPAHPRHPLGFPNRLDHPPVTGVGAIKRDPGEDTLPQLRRPHSTGNVPDLNAGVPGPAHAPPHHPQYSHGPPPPPPQHQQHQSPHPHHSPQNQHPLQQPLQQQQQQQSPAAPPPHQQQHHMDERRQMGSFDGGHAPHLNRQPSYPPQTPATPYEQPHLFNGPSSAAQEGFLITSYASSSTAKRKAQRASQACDNCRQLKAKCDETKPCKNCREKKVDCKYRDPIPKQQDKFATEILDSLNFLKSELIKTGRRLDRIERQLVGAGVPDDVKRESDNDDYNTTPGGNLHESPAPIGLDTEVEHDEAFGHGAHEGLEPHEHEDQVMNDAPAAMAGIAPLVDPALPSTEGGAEAVHPVGSEEPEEAPGEPVPPGQSSIAMNHKTPAGLLLRWPAVKNMVQHLLDAEGIKYAGEYPLRQEERRGLLRLYGRGEGRDKAHSSGRDPLRDATRDASGDPGTDHGQISLPASADSPDVAASPSPDYWGMSGGGPFSPSSVSDPKSAAPKVAGGGGGSISGAKELDLDPETVWMYAKSYEENIQNMHPIIFPGELRGLVTVFLEGLPVKPAKNIPTAKFAQAEEVGSKRKRSPTAGGVGEVHTSTPSATQKVGRPYRTIANAVVLCIIALGKIVALKDRLPEPVADDPPPPPPSSSNAAPLGSPALRNGFLPASPSQGSPPSVTSAPHTSVGLPSPKDVTEAQPRAPLPSSRRTSVQGPHPGKMTAAAAAAQYPRRNMDVIPGLDYFSLATDIIGNQLAGTTLNHVYANLLAGLYYGQLGRVLESYRHICVASLNIQQMLRSQFARLSQMVPMQSPDTVRDNRLTFAFWTCLQLESDIVAELAIPQSGILQYEDKMPYPNESLALESGVAQRVVRGYTAQLFLRKQLNMVHKNLYNPNNKQDRGTVTLVKDLSSMLSQNLWCDQQYYKFSDDEEPAADFLQARLRAKYWGASVITYRPIIRAILNRRFHKEEQAKRAKLLAEGKTLDAQESDVYDEFDEDVDPADPEIIALARRGIRALIESTRAFHNVRDRRLIITNVFGTAHAQWGNLVTLAAVYRDPILGGFVDGEVLRQLFHRTIDYLSVVAQPSSALATDQRILIFLEKELFSPRPSMAPANSSFSSTTSGGHPPFAYHPAATASSPVSPHDYHQQPGPPPPPQPQVQQMSYAAVAAAAIDPGGALKPRFHHPPPPPLRDDSTPEHLSPQAQGPGPGPA